MERAVAIDSGVTVVARRGGLVEAVEALQMTNLQLVYLVVLHFPNKWH